MSERAPGNVVIEAGGKPVFQDNVFVGLSPDSFVTLDELARLQLKDSNWFPGAGGPAGCKEAAERCTDAKRKRDSAQPQELNRTVGPALKKK
jgi:hypothetical protein